MEVVNTTYGELASFGGSNWGAETSSQDLIVPKLMLMQAMSELVVAGKARAGDIINSLDENVVSDKDGTIDVIVFSSYKTVNTFVNDEYNKTETWNVEIGNLPYEETLNGTKINRQHVLNFYVLTVDEIRANTAFPSVVSFKGTSMYTGRKLATMMTRQKALGQPSASLVFTLGRTLEKNDKGSYYVWTAAKKRSSTMEEVTAAKIWWDVLAKRTVTVDAKE